MSKKLKFIFTILAAIIAPVMVALVYTKLPAQVPTNWGFNGTVSYSDKNMLWILSLIPIAIALLLYVAPRIDPKRKNYQKFEGAYEGFILVLMLFLDVLVAVTIVESFYPGTLSIPGIICTILGLLFVFIGNVMPKFKQNYFMGIKTPWTLSDEQIWNKTHRMAGFLWFFGGILCVLSAFFLKDVALFAAFMSLVLLMVLIPLVMSYVWYRKKVQG